MLSRFFGWLWRDASALEDSTAPRLTKTQALIVLLMGLLASSFAARVMLAYRVDSDALWHIRTGQWIVENGRIPSTDVFSWIGAERGLAWTPHEWFFDIVLWGVYSVASFPGLYLVTCLTFGLYTTMVFCLAYRRSGEWVMSLIISVIAMLGTAPFLAPRPQVATFALLTGVALLLELRRPYLALALMLIGVNVHGAMYPVYLGLFAFYCLPRRDLAPMVASIFMTIVTPIGWKLIPYPMFAFDSQVTMFQEYAPTVLRKSWVLLVSFVGIVLLIDRRRVPVWDGLLVLSLSLLAISAVRHTTLFFGIALPVLAPYLQFPRPVATAEDSVDATGALRLPDPDRMLAVGLALAIALSVARIWGGSIDVDKGYPADAVTWLQEESTGRIWNEWGDGGYLIYRGMPTFVDGRADPFSPFFDRNVTIASDVAAAYYLTKDPREVVSAYQIEHTLLKKSSPLFQVYVQSRDFRQVYSDEKYAVFETLGFDRVE